jgi:GrpB-like predicted nucleotidyltransferase (UPF0157 family)
VPGLTAKPIIDMSAAYANLEEARHAFEPLAGLGKNTALTVRRLIASPSAGTTSI